MDQPDAEMAEAQAALANTLEATAAILPWLKPKAPRFPPEISKRWQEISARLAAAWSERHGEGLADVRPAIFELYSAALESGDPDCLRLSEALASATDHLEAAARDNSQLAAALSATLECLTEDQCLEHAAFPERAQHFAARLERCADPKASGPSRSRTLDRIFAEDAHECLERIRTGLSALPPDAYAVKSAGADIVRLTEPLELDAIGALAGRLVRLITLRAGEHCDLEAGETRSAVFELLAELEKAINQLL